VHYLVGYYLVCLELYLGVVAGRYAWYIRVSESVHLQLTVDITQCDIALELTWTAGVC
jgi:hypothetical protein